MDKTNKHILIAFFTIVCIGCVGLMNIFKRPANKAYKSTTTFGTIESIDGDIITITSEDNNSMTLDINENTAFIKDDATTDIDSLKKNEYVMITTTDGIVTVVNVLDQAN